MPPQLLHIIRLEPHIGVDPQRLIKPIVQSVTAQLVAGLIDRRVPLNPPHRIPATLQFDQSCLTLRNNPPLKRDEDRTPGRGRVDARRGGRDAEREIVVGQGLHG